MWMMLHPETKSEVLFTIPLFELSDKGKLTINLFPGAIKNPWLDLFIGIGYASRIRDQVCVHIDFPISLIFVYPCHNAPLSSFFDRRFDI